MLYYSVGQNETYEVSQVELFLSGSCRKRYEITHEYKKDQKWTILRFSAAAGLQKILTLHVAATKPFNGNGRTGIFVASSFQMQENINYILNVFSEIPQ